MFEQELVEKNILLVPFNGVEAAIAQYKVENAKLVFNYEDPQGNKEARSHIFKLRQVKSNIAAIHKEVKASILEVSREIDAKKNVLTAAVEDMIKVHDEPLEIIARRIAAEKAEQQRLIQEEKDKAEAARLEAIRQREEANLRRQAELDAQAAALNAKQAEIDRVEREKRIAAEAEQRVKEAAERQIKEAEERHRLELQAAENKRLADLKAAEEKAAREKTAQEAEQVRLAEIEAKRQANKKHREKVESEVRTIFLNYGLPEKNTARLVEALSKDLFPTLKIIY